MTPTGICHRSLGQLDRAIDDFREALELVEAQPDDHLEIFFHLAAALYDAGRLHECLSILERHLQLDPEDPEVARRIQQVRSILARGPGPQGPGGSASSLPAAIWTDADGVRQRFQVSA